MLKKSGLRNKAIPRSCGKADSNLKTTGKREEASPAAATNDENARLYKALRIICGFSRPEDLFELKKQEFLRLCEITQIHWELKGRLFRDSPILNAGPPSADTARYGAQGGSSMDTPSRPAGAVPRSVPSGSLKPAPSPGRFELALTIGGRRYGKLIFISSRKISRKQKTFLSRTGDMVASSLCFMEDTKQLEASKNQWDLVFDSFYRALCITDSQFRILRANRAFRRLTGRKKTETAGQNVFTVFPVPVRPPPSQKGEVTWLAESPAGAAPLSLEFLMKTVFLKNERLTFRLFLIKDVTEEIKMERKIAAQTRSRELGLIKSSLAHELNNPIAGIKALLTVIESGLTCSSQKRLLGNMHSAVDRCQETVTRLLSVSRRDRFNGKTDAV